MASTGRPHKQIATIIGKDIGTIGTIESKPMSSTWSISLPTNLRDAVDQTIIEKFPKWSRLAFAQKAIRFTLDNLEEFKTSTASVVEATEFVQSVERTNRVREQWDEIAKYADVVSKDPGAQTTERRITHFLRLIAKMLFLMNE